jgi:predicted amidophosphoribosyltransferase
MGWFMFWLLCAAAAAMIGASKGRGGLGFLLGFLFGPFGILFALLIGGNRRECPSCKTKIHKDATVCPMCRSAVPAEAPTIHDESTGMPTTPTQAKEAAMARAKGEEIIERAKNRGSE